MTGSQRRARVHCRSPRPPLARPAAARDPARAGIARAADHVEPAPHPRDTGKAPVALARVSTSPSVPTSPCSVTTWRVTITCSRGTSRRLRTGPNVERSDRPGRRRRQGDRPRDRPTGTGSPPGRREGCDPAGTPRAMRVPCVGSLTALFERFRSQSILQPAGRVCPSGRHHLHPFDLSVRAVRPPPGPQGPSGSSLLAHVSSCSSREGAATWCADGWRDARATGGDGPRAGPRPPRAPPRRHGPAAGGRSPPGSLRPPPAAPPQGRPSAPA
jgi:hypothetical protein